MAIFITDVIARMNALLKEHGNLEVCRVGHFGEIHEMYSNDFNLYAEARGGIFGEGEQREVISIDAPDIGPEPD